MSPIQFSPLRRRGADLVTMLSEATPPLNRKPNMPATKTDLGEKKKDLIGFLKREGKGGNYSRLTLSEQLRAMR